MANEIKRHFYNGIDYKIDEENKRVHLLPSFHEKLNNKKLWGRFGFKKIGGSSIGDVLQVDKFKSQFGAFCRMSWIGLPILDRKYVDAGVAIEPKVVQAIEEKTHKKVETYDPYKYNFDFFADKDDVVGGLPDGFIEESNMIIEIKTTKETNLEKWMQWGVPAAYLKQAQLYAYLMDAKEYAIVATFLKEDDYLDPSKYPIKERNIKTWRHATNVLQAKDDIDKVKEWYYDHINSGVSPQWDESKDQELLQWLRCSSPDEWDKLKQEWIKEGKLVI